MVSPPLKIHFQGRMMAPPAPANAFLGAGRMLSNLAAFVGAGYLLSRRWKKKEAFLQIVFILVFLVIKGEPPIARSNWIGNC